MANHRDDYYIKQVLKGKTNAFAILVERHKDMVFTLAMKMLKDRGEAEEVAQDTFVKCYQSLARFKGESKFSTWLYKIAYNKCLDSLKRNKRYVIPDSISAMEGKGGEELNALQQIAKKDRDKAVQQAIRTLPEEEQLLILLYYFEELAIKEIAKIVHLSEANIKVKLFRSRKFLYELLDKNTLIRE